MSDGTAAREWRKGNSRPGVSTLWLLAFTLLIGIFFAEHLFLGRSLLPLDVLNQMLLPRDVDTPMEIQTHYPIDEVTQLAPGARFWKKSLSNGELPLWNRFILGGNPHQASGTWGVFTPFKLPLLILSAERGYTLGLVFQFWLAGVLMFVYLRELERSPSAAFLGACAWSLSSNFIMFHWLYLNVFTWLPLVFFCWERAVARRSIGWFFACASTLALSILGGSMQFAGFMAFAWMVYALGSFRWFDNTDRSLGLRCILGTGFAVVLLTALYWLPLAEYLRLETLRFQNLEPGAAGIKHTLLGILALGATFMFPGLAGSPASFDLLKGFGGNLIDFNGSIGVVPWILCVIGVIGWRTPRARNFLTLAAIVLFIVFFTPLQRFVYHRFLLLVVFAAVVFAAAGWDRIGAMSRQGEVQFARMIRRFAWVGVLLGLCLVVFEVVGALRRAELVAWLEPRILEGASQNQFGVFPEWLRARVPRLMDHFKLSNPVFAIPLICLGIAAWAVSRRVSGKSSDIQLKMVLMLCAIVDLSFTLRDRVPRVDMGRFPYYPPIPLLEPLRLDSAEFRIHRWVSGQSIVVQGKCVVGLRP